MSEWLKGAEEGWSASKTWSLHVGESYRDVPRTHPAYREIETLLHKGIALGCSEAEFCPDGGVRRSEAAMFVARAAVGGDSHIPATNRVYDCRQGGVSFFADVAPTDLACRAIHYVTLRVESGCGESNFCPSAPADRRFLASAVAEMNVGEGPGVPRSYGPDLKTGRSYRCDAVNPDVHFQDIPPSDPLCARAHYLWAKGVVEGCSEDAFCPEKPVTRAGMSNFVVDGFGLSLYDTGRPVPPPSSCGVSSLCLDMGRYALTAQWEAPDGRSGYGQGVTVSQESGYFWFFEPENVELAVKVLNGCGINGRRWVFMTGLTNVRVTITVVDRVTGNFQIYSNAQGSAFQPILDTEAFSNCEASASVAMAGPHPEEPRSGSFDTGTPTDFASPLAVEGRCVASDTALCLGRFRVEGNWQTASGQTGPARVLPLTPKTGAFWFFEPGNMELIVKVLDACTIGQGRWVFAAGMTDVAVELRVTDTATGAVRTYSRPTGKPFEPILDTGAFPDSCASSVALAEANESGD